MEKKNLCFKKYDGIVEDIFLLLLLLISSYGGNGNGDGDYARKKGKESEDKGDCVEVNEGVNVFGL